ncbi:MAG: N-acetylglucosamine-6-phosphate deacetylase, partial [Patescibacteria group bacterium]|nr:N-acetylglucosamine-6-phosphate deacetylase [Patescibacteria group bacterium]
MRSYIINCRLYNNPDKLVHIGVSKGKIVEIIEKLDVSESILFDAKDMILAPGLIDTHVHGAGGA